jgi:sugar lactone lactonase YvrE
VLSAVLIGRPSFVGSGECRQRRSARLIAMNVDRAAKPPIHPVVWRPPRAPARARQRSSAGTFDLQLVDLPAAGEDVAVDGAGRVVVGVADGRILRIEPSGAAAEIANTGGRPLGIEIAPDGTIVVCDFRRGVLRVDPDTGLVAVLVDEFAGEPLVFCNNSTVGRDGTIYFTDSSTRFDQPHYVGELLAHTGTGRLFRRAPGGAVDLVTDGLDFANGVTLSPGEDFLIVAETGGYRLQRIWLTGPRSGRREVLVENLPGLPDNVSTGSDGLFWVALPSPRSRTLDLLLPLPPVFRKAVWAMPERLRPKDTPTVWVQAYDATGVLVHDLQTTHPRFRMVSGVRESGGTVWLGSLESAAIGRITL